MKAINEMTAAEMVAEYNNLTGKSIKKFSTRAAGEKQLANAREEHKAANIEESKKVAEKKPAIMDIASTVAFAKKIAEDKAAAKDSKKSAAKAEVKKPAAKVEVKKDEPATVVEIEKKPYSLADGCPSCGSKVDQTAAGLEGTVAGENRMFCHHCSTEYFHNGRIYNAPKKSDSRSKGISESWNDPEVAAKRSERHHVKVGSEVYRSVLEAFKKLHLPVGQHIKFRMALKAAKELEFKIGDKSFKFSIFTEESK